MVTTQNLSDLLGGQDRGDFMTYAKVSQRFKEDIRAITANVGVALTEDKKEAIDMMIHRIALIVTGEHERATNWMSLAGYAIVIGKDIEAKAKMPRMATIPPDEPGFVQGVLESRDFDELSSGEPDFGEPLPKG